MNLLLLASGDLWAGAESVIYHLAKGLKDYNDIRVSAVFLNYGRLASLCKDLGVETCVLDETKYPFPVLIKQLAEITYRIGPDIIHSHRYKENLLSAMVAPVAGFPKLITTLHGISEVKCGFKKQITSSVNTQLMKRVYAKTVAVSEDLAIHLTLHMGVPSSRVRLIYNGINLEASSISLNRSTGTITIGSAGRLVPVKDYALMVDIAAVVCSRWNNVRFLLAGDGPQMAVLRKRVYELGLDEQFVFLGHVNDIREFYSSLDVYLNTSIHEGIPMTVLEAMSHSLPVVAPAVGGLAEIIEHGLNGYIISSREVETFAQALEELVVREDLRHKMGENARRRVENNFSMKSMVHSYLALYYEILNQVGIKR